MRYLIVLMLLLATPAPAQDIPPRVIVLAWASHYGMELVPANGSLYRMSWCPPTTGTKVEHYVVQIEKRVDGSTWPQAWQFLDPMSTPVYCDDGHDDGLRVRVAGVDSLGRQGPFSEWCGYGDSCSAAPCEPWEE